MNDAPTTDRFAAAYAKWGEVLNAGFQLVPDMLIKNQGRLGLSATDLVVLLNVTMHWWYAEQLPYPKTATIAQRTGVTVRTVQRSLQRLEKRGFIHRIQDESTDATKLDPRGLVQYLTPYAKKDPGYRQRFPRHEVEDVA